MSVELNNLIKTQFLKEHINAIPDDCVLQEIAPFEKNAKLGSQIEVPVILRRSGSFKVAPAGEFMTLPTERGFQTGKAILNASQFGAQESISSSDAQRAASDKQAYQVWQGNILTPSWMAYKSRLEQHILNGGLVSKVASASSTGSGPYTHTVVLDAAYFAEATFAGSEDTGYVDVYATEASTTAKGTGAKLVSVDFDTLTVVLESAAAITFAAGDCLYWENTKGKIAPSLRDQLKNTGTMFGINAALYSLWKPTAHVIAGAGKLTRTEALKAVSKAVSRGGLSEDSVLLCHPTIAQNLANDEASNRSYDSSYSSKMAENGSEGVRWTVTAGFKVELRAHPNMFPSEAYIVAKSALKRYGSCDTMLGGAEANGVTLDPIFNHPSGFGLAMRFFTEQAIAVLCPAQCVRITNANGAPL